MTSGLVVLALAVLAALLFGGYRALTDGRFRGTHRVRGVVSTGSTTDGRSTTATIPDTDTSPVEEKAPRHPSPDHGVADHDLGERATLLQFSSAFCAPCRATRRTLADVAAIVPGVVHVEIDAEQHLDLVRRLGILRTPTTLILDGRGHELTRATGAPRKRTGAVRRWPRASP